MGSPATDQRKRRRARKRLEDQGVPPDRIAGIIDRMRAEQDARRAAQPRPLTTAERREEVRRLHAEREAVYEATHQRIAGDDRKFRPTHRDPLTEGVARVAGVTAKAARRGKTFTKWETEQMGAAG